MILITPFELTEFCPYILFCEFFQLAGLTIPAFPPRKRVHPLIDIVPSKSIKSPSDPVFAPQISKFPPDITIFPFASKPSAPAFTYISPPLIYI